MFDFHMHSRVSFDSDAQPADMVRAAAGRGLKEICFTDHQDFVPDHPELCYHFAVEDYRAAYAQIHEVDPRVRVRLGVEICTLPDDPEKFARLAAAQDYDFVICSQHFVGKEDPYQPEYFEGKTQRQAYLGYLEAQARDVRRHTDYDVLGHLGYPVRFYQGELPNHMAYADYRDLFDVILRHLVLHGKGLEVNTRSFPVTGGPIASADVLRRYRELGGEIITTGSDAHDPSLVGAHLRETLRLLGELGFRYVCTFEKRKPVFHTIEGLYQ